MDGTHGAADLTRRRLALGEVARTQQHAMPSCGELPANLQADAAIRPGD
jgi:hypothetical protein